MIRLGSLFSDGAVLQRNMQIPVWGETTPKTIVRAVCGKAEGFSMSNANGKFTVYLPAMPAGGPLELKVSTKTECVTVQDVMIGEVWIAGGQSNMQYQLNSDWALKHPEDSTELLSRIQEHEFQDTIQDPEQVRSILIPRLATGTEEDSFSGKWRKMTRNNASEFSAVGAWFAKTIQEKLKVPVGIIESNWGGTIVETWTSRNGLVRNPETASMLRMVDHHFRKERAWTNTHAAINIAELEKFSVKDTENKGYAQGWAAPEMNDSEWKEMQVPGSWLQQKISGNGALWVRKTVDVPEKWTGRPLVLYISRVDKHDTTYFNGIEIGRTGKDFETQYWDTVRRYDIPADAVKSGRAEVAIRAYSFLYDGYIGDVQLEDPENGERLSMNGSWKVCAETNLGILSPANDPDKKYCHGNQNIPATLFNSMIRPLIPYAMRGVIWYQGESNAGTQEDAKSYYAKLRCMIEDWRYQWAQGDFPFIQMILAGFRVPKSFSPEDAWPILRESQIRLCEEMSGVYGASAIDLGDEKDIHPMNKKDAGLRMARIALAKVYQEKGIVPAGPHLQKWSVEGNTIRLEFENSEGLAFRKGQAKGFSLFDAGMANLSPESIVIENNMVLIKFKSEEFPRELYYCWADNPDSSLENEAGLPADPFHIIL